MFFGPTKPKANKLLSKAFQTGNFSAAISAFEKLKSKNPDDIEILNNLGVAYLESGDYESAEVQLRAAINLEEASLPQNNLGRALLQQKKFDEAEQVFLRARELDKSDPQPWYNLTVCKREQGNSNEGLAELRKFLEVFPGHTNGQNDLGCYFDEEGKTEEAIKCFEKAASSDPSHIPSRLNLIRLLCDNGRYPETKEHLDGLAQYGWNIKVHLGEVRVNIEINGKPFYSAKRVKSVR